MNLICNISLLVNKFDSHRFLDDYNITILIHLNNRLMNKKNINFIIYLYNTLL